MQHKPRDIDSIFLDAIEKPTAEAWNKFVQEACKEVGPLRARVEKLLIEHEKAAESYLESSVPGLPELEQTLDANQAALDAGFSVTFGAEAAVIVGRANHSVLKALGKQLAQSRVFLCAMHLGDVIKPFAQVQRKHPRDRTTVGAKCLEKSPAMQIKRDSYEVRNFLEDCQENR